MSDSTIIEKVCGATLSAIKDPFSIDCIEEIHIRIYKHVITNQPTCYARVEFQNGQTKGEHKIGNYPDIQTLMPHLEAFINELKNKSNENKSN